MPPVARILAVTLVAAELAVIAILIFNHNARSSGKYYLSLGDSYAIGYQPVPGGPTPGFASFVAETEGFRLVNFGCSGATTSSILTRPGCGSPAMDGATYGGLSQAAAADRFIRTHRGQIGMITVSIGGNDLVACASDPQPTTCVETADSHIGTNVTRLAKQLRAAAGPDVPIIGLTYPDIILGAWVYPRSEPNRNLAVQSVTAFKSLINPTLSRVYGSVGASFLDVTAATGGYRPLSDRVLTASYGRIPYAVAQVCSLTWACSRGDIHANTLGYEFIGKMIVSDFSRITQARPRSHLNTTPGSTGVDGPR